MLLDVLTAVYDLESSEADWLAGVATESAAGLPGGLAGVGYSYRDVQVSTPIHIGGATELLHVPHEAHRLLSQDVLAQLYGQGPRSGPSASYFHAVGKQLPENVKRMYRGIGIADMFAVTAPRPSRTKITLGLALDPTRYRCIDDHDWEPLRVKWDAIAMHLDHAALLRQELRDGSATIEARLDPHGRGELSELAVPSRDELTAAVLASERARVLASDEEPCRWSHLLDGLWSVIRRRTRSGGIEYLAIRNPTAILRRLDARERAVAALAATGEYNKRIAERLGIHESTASRILGRALQKLGLATRSDLILLHAALQADDR